MNTFRFICSNCGVRVECPETDAGKTVLCGSCLKPLRVPSLGEGSKLELESEEAATRRGRDDFLLGPANANPAAQRSLATPPAPPTQAKDPDKALVNVALGIFRLNNWPCQEELGYRAFAARVKFHSQQLAVTTVDNYRVLAARGILTLESPVLELPDLPGVPILETLNEINQRSVSSTFALTPAGVVMRHAVLPRARDEGFLSGAMILQTLRQMNHDRRHALSLLRTVVESGALDPVEVVRAFAQPLAPCLVRSPSLDEAAELAAFAGFQVQRLNGQLAVSRNGNGTAARAVHVAACPGLLRGWVVVGEPSPVLGTWTFIPPTLRGLCENIRVLNGNDNQLLAQLNALNADAGLLRFVSVKRQAVATATCFPTDRAISPSQFRAFADALLDCAEHSVAAAPRPLAKAG